MFTGKSLITVLAALVVFAAFAYAGTMLKETASDNCVTQEQVVAHADRSRNGISLTCNDEIRQRHLAAGKAAAQQR